MTVSKSYLGFFFFSVWAKHVLCHSRIAFKIIKIYIYARGSGCIRLLPHRQWITDPWKQGKGVFRNGSRKLRRRRNFSCAGLQTTVGRIINFSLLQHATSPNTWAHILKLLNTSSHVTFLLLELQLYKKNMTKGAWRHLLLLDSSLLVAQHVICFDFDINKDHHNRKCLRLSNHFTN